MSSQSWYDVLGVSNDATAEDIQKAYRAKAREFHPDRAGNDGSQFKRMKEGVDVLLDPEQRKNYDKKLASGETIDDNEDSSQADAIQLGGGPRPSEELMAKITKLEEQFQKDGYKVPEVPKEVKDLANAQLEKCLSGLNLLKTTINAAQSLLCPQCKKYVYGSMADIHAHLATHSALLNDWLTSSTKPFPLKISDVTQNAIHFETSEMMKIYDLSATCATNVMKPESLAELLRIAKVAQRISSASDAEGWLFRKRQYTGDYSSLSSLVSKSSPSNGATIFATPNRPSLSEPTNPNHIKQWKTSIANLFSSSERGSSSSSQAQPISLGVSSGSVWHGAPNPQVLPEAPTAWTYQQSTWFSFTCVDCSKVFSTWVAGNRHHCRACGKEVCTACSMKPAHRDVSHGHAFPVPICRGCVPSVAIREFNEFCPSIYNRKHIEDSKNLAKALYEIYGNPAGPDTLKLPSIDTENGNRLIYQSGTGPDTTIPELIHLVVYRAISRSKAKESVLATASSSSVINNIGSNEDECLVQAFQNAIRNDVASVIWAINGNPDVHKACISALTLIATSPMHQWPPIFCDNVATTCIVLEEIRANGWNAWEFALKHKLFAIAQRLVSKVAVSWQRDAFEKTQRADSSMSFTFLLLQAILALNVKDNTQMRVNALLTVATCINPKNDTQINMWIDIFENQGIHFSKESIELLIVKLFEQRLNHAHCEELALYLIRGLPEQFSDLDCLQKALSAGSSPVKGLDLMYLGFMMGSSDLIDLHSTKMDPKEKFLLWVHMMTSVWYVNSAYEYHAGSSNFKATKQQMDQMMNETLRSVLKLLCLIHPGPEDPSAPKTTLVKSRIIRECWNMLSTSVGAMDTAKLSPTRFLDLVALQAIFLTSPISSEVTFLLGIADLQLELANEQDGYAKLGEEMLLFINRHYSAFMSSDAKAKVQTRVYAFLKEYKPDIAKAMQLKASPEQFILKEMNTAYLSRNSIQMARHVMDAWRSFDLQAIRIINTFLTSKFGPGHAMPKFDDQFVVYLGKAVEALLSPIQSVQGYQHLSEALMVGQLLDDSCSEMLEFAYELMSSPSARLASVTMLESDVHLLKSSLFRSDSFQRSQLKGALAPISFQSSKPTPFLPINIWSHRMVKALRKSELNYLKSSGYTPLEHARFYFDLAFWASETLGGGFLLASYLQCARYLILHAEMLPSMPGEHESLVSTRAKQYAAVQAAIHSIVLPFRQLNYCTSLRFTQIALDIMLQILKSFPWAMTAADWLILVHLTEATVRLAPVFPLLNVAGLSLPVCDSLLSDLSLRSASIATLVRQASIISTVPEEGKFIPTGSIKLSQSSNQILSGLMRNLCSKFAPLHVLAYYIFEGRWRGWFTDVDEKSIRAEVDLTFEALKEAQLEHARSKPSSSNRDVVMPDDAAEARKREAEEHAKNLEVERRVELESRQRIVKSRKASMVELLQQKSWNFSQVQALMNAYPVTRDKDGFYLTRMARKVPASTPAIPNAKWGRIRGLTIDVKTGEISIHTDKASTTPLTSMDDVVECSRLGGSPGAVFSLDHPEDSDAEGGITMPSHPFQSMRYAPASMVDTGLLATMFHTDYLLKMFTCGIEISSTAPFPTRNLDQLLIGVHPPLAQGIRDYISKERKRASEFSTTDSNSHRFWIEAGDIELYEQDHANTSKMSYWFGDVKMTVKKHATRINEAGRMEDDENDDPNGPEAKLAALLTRHYTELGQAFPEFERLRELQKIMAIGLIIHSRAKAANDALTPEKLGELKVTLLPECMDMLRNLLNQLPAQYPITVSDADVEESVNGAIRSAGYSSWQVPSDQMSTLRSQARSVLETQAREASHRLESQVKEVLEKYGVPSYYLNQEARNLLHSRSIQSAANHVVQKHVDDFVAARKTLLAKLKTYGWEGTSRPTAGASAPLSSTACCWVPAAFAQYSTQVQNAETSSWSVYGGVSMAVNFTNRVLNPPPTSQWALGTTTLVAQRVNAIPNSNAQLMDNLRLANQLQAANMAANNVRAANARAAASSSGGGGNSRPPPSTNPPLSKYRGRQQAFLAVADNGPNARLYSKPIIDAIQRSVDQARESGKSRFMAPVINGEKWHWCHKNPTCLGGSNEVSNTYFGPPKDNLSRAHLEKQAKARKEERLKNA